MPNNCRAAALHENAPPVAHAGRWAPLLCAQFLRSGGPESVVLSAESGVNSAEKVGYMRGVVYSPLPYVAAFVAVTLLSTGHAQNVESSAACSEGTEPLMLNYGDHTTGCAISPAVDVDTFTFEGSAGDNIRIAGDNTGGPFDPGLELVDPGGSTIANAGCSGGCCGGVHCSFVLNTTLTVSGTYTLILSDSGTDEAGGLGIQIDRIPPLIPAPVLNYNSSSTDAIDPAIDMDFYKFQGVEGTRIRISVQNRGGPFDPRLRILDPRGLIIEEGSCDGGCCGGVDCGFTMDKILEATGTYYLLISDAGSDESGGYVISLQCLVGRCEIPARIPGDCNEDNTLDLSDAVCIFGVLFLGTPSAFPCGNGLPGDAGNISLLDWQPDGRVDISDGIGLLDFLFLGGPPHPLASSSEPRTTGIVFPNCP